MEHYQVLKKNEITAFSEKWIDLECVMLSEVTQFLKKNNYMFSLTRRTKSILCMYVYI